MSLLSLLLGSQWRTPGGLALPAPIVQREIARAMHAWRAPAQAPSALMPPSQAADGGKALHIRAPARLVPRPDQGQVCEDCVNFRYEAGQEWLRVHGDPFRDDPGRFGPRANLAGVGGVNSADLGLCAASDGNCLTARFWGERIDYCDDCAGAGKDWGGEPCRRCSGTGEVVTWRCPDYARADGKVTSLDPRKGRRFEPLGGGKMGAL